MRAEPGRLQDSEGVDFIRVRRQEGKGQGRCWPPWPPGGSHRRPGTRTGLQCLLRWAVRTTWVAQERKAQGAGVLGAGHPKAEPWLPGILPTRKMADPRQVLRSGPASQCMG